MKVSELIEELQAFEPEAEVHFSYNYGDHWRTTVAPKVNIVDVMRVSYSNYHSMPKIVDEDDTRYDDATEVVVITS